ncbi:hypothetical protein ACFQXA_16300 [Nocardiopsis composta]
MSAVHTQNTARRRKSTRSAGLSRPWLHSRAARMVRCRGGRPSAPVASSRNRSSSRSSTCSAESTRTRAAASSRASGTPSSIRQMRSTASVLPGVSRKPGRAAVARSTKSRTAS